MHFHFKTDFLYYKNTQNVRKILGLNPQNTLLTQFFFWAPAAAKENSDDEFLHLSLDLLTFFQNDNWVFSSTSAFH